ncbi:cytochrome P450 [Aspergillus clavatus NRRL 1]|uniref:Cytochrome P450 monooxygenase ccsG n=1 Tax=Aspergillus clavatus (strain ATCC 1007 / CBS 513.65 / DSM 816 / NCTC 3887 / NRRL 1 / QM 1276 / 107) TaxID=344612 RepID=CCSG_ASPCL|nr:cytochrome P450 [Aspergillus clavatus NRRL 1]A1CLZ3.1 RecName: Full=Cytochrome P450 monooxygenase ccsG; AltName: Full=Cytochalasin biosynthesis protein G; Flags: Precursor [Aspergillus clavatus NRRL 1]EAW09122.1 cytochrome P450 [Aspergillus clavatus NRRL 1]
MMITLFTLAVVSIGFFLWWLLTVQPAVTKRALKHIPELRFEDNDTPERYTQDSRSLLFRGYDKYLRHGIPFQMRHPIEELGPQVLLPMKYLDEVKYASTSLFSFPLFSEKVFLLNYSNAPRQTDAAAHVVRVDLTKNLGALANGMYQEAIEGLNQSLSASEEWNTLPAYDFLSSLTAQVTALALVGPELCRNREWIDISLQTTFAIFNAAFTIRSQYSPRWRWLARWQSDAPKRMRAMRARAVELLAPVYQDRLAAIKEHDFGAFADCLHWSLRGNGGETSLTRIAEQQLFLTVASMHTTSSTLTAVLFDLLIRPEYCAEITKEMQEALTECEGKWTLQEVAKMRKLDSFMKESQRVHPIGFITAQRMTVRPHTFKDGLHLPAGVIFQFPADAVHHDPAIYPRPDQFAGYRFLHLRETVDANRYHFASVSDTMLGFGAGSHACPGRFFTSLAIKLILVVLLTQYEVKLADCDGSRPANGFNDFNMGPSREATIMIRKRSGL